MPTDAPIPHINSTPFYLKSQGAWIFGWWHFPPSATHGVLLCPPLGHEQVHSHRTWRKLAESMAAQGLAVLRLDYHGTGDADGSELDAERIPTFLNNISNALNWLRTDGGCTVISLLGLRMGATLAAMVAEQHAVHNLVLWAPIVSGRRYARELTGLKLASKLSANSTAASLEAMGFSYTQETIAALSSIDISTLHPQFQRALILQSDAAPTTSTLLDSWKNTNSDVQQITFTGYSEMMAEPHDTVIPETAIQDIVKWCAAGEVTRSIRGDASDKYQLTTITLNGMSVQEQIHQLHASKQLFGLISTPTADDNHLPWVLFINAGSAYHIGPGRIHVTMARQLASAGYPCLRMDVSGLGESPPDGDRAANDCYAASSFNDVALAMDYLQTLDARRKIVLVGICSGAYVAFQGAAQYTHAALMASIVMNPLTYFWREGMSLNEAPNEKARVWHRYRDAIFNPSKWLRLLSGKTHLSIGQAARAAMRLLVPSRRLAMQSCTHNNSTQSSWGHPATQNLAADLMKVRSNQRKLVLIVSEEEPGHFLLMNQAKKEAEQLLAEGSLHVEFIANADHTFSTQSAREALRSALLAQLQGMLN